AVSTDAPVRPGLVEPGAGDPGTEGDVLTELETVGDVLGVAENLRLRGVALGPGPLLPQLPGEVVAVEQAGHVAARARVPVPVPHPADVTGGLVDVDPEPALAQAVEEVHAGEARPDHDHVVGGCPVSRLLVSHVCPLPGRVVAGVMSAARALVSWW